ncbi:glycoside hydrolase family 5 protein [Pseudomassariella vexata]|uniref:Glycoside hydrolase family 5 protein n=1 Tax=Pseudomassariella vexata TaxID=1141098 RepID=A0A1Y2EEC2_9PEZI|nr:glycoside hydrolase family 5 protein [Pseudomassariella vexata]ORY69919.1 glycoside hydrolase family 5 protein [Pseudomassariella vexata]
MRFSSLAVAVLGFVIPAQGQELPLKSDSRWILDNSGQRVKLRCINWAGHGETNIPEGLHKQSINYIADFIKDQGFNCVRLTYSIDHALNPETTVRGSFTAAAGASGLPVETLDGLYQQVTDKNSFIGNATTQDVFGAVIKALWDRQVMTILDNHVSKASWCCNLTDGNGWWDEAFGYNDANSRFFKTNEWLDGLSAMATWSKTQPGVVGMSLRNEMRPFLLQDLNGHADWYNFVNQGGKRVHAANPEVLVVVGGSQSATDLSFIKTKNVDYSAWAGKHVWEMHAYSFTVTFPDPFDSCDMVQGEYGLLDGFVLEQGKGYTGPLIVSEFGVGMSGGPNDGLSDGDKSYFDCIKEWMKGNDADWALWALQGTYYIREGKAEYEETWGLMDKEWKTVRNDKFPGMMAELFEVTQGP